MSASQYPRDAAIRVLTKVLSDHQPLDEALESAQSEVSAEYRPWLQENCSGVLRWKGRLELAIDSIALTRKPTGWLRKVLLLACYQLCAQDRTNPGRIVSETVAAVKRKDGEAPARFANALLRKVSAHAADWRALPSPELLEGPDGAQWASLPQWFWTRLVRDHGTEWAEGFALSCLERPRIWVRARGDLWTQGPGRTPGPVAGSFHAELGGPVTGWPGFAEGAFFVQDISSQLLVHEISAEVLARGGRTALDLCAAPGGKSVGMAWSGLDVVASDRDSSRLELLKQTCARVAPEIRVSTKAELKAFEPFDLVWVDAPCSGAGIIRRHPDVRWLRREGEIGGLRKTQAEVIAEGWDKVRPGGLFAYSVCSVFVDEGERSWREAGLRGKVIKSWSLSPHQPPYGDGFWAVLVQKL